MRPLDASAPLPLPAAPPRGAARPSPQRAVALGVGATLLAMAVAAILQVPGALGFSLHRFAELALLAGCALAPAAYAAVRGLGYADGKAALFVACALLGLPLLRAAAIYQLEGQTFAFLLAWGLVCLVTALLAGFDALWLLALALLNLGLFQVWGAPNEIDDFARPTALFGLNGLWLVALWAVEAVAGRRAAPWHERAVLALTCWWGVAAGSFALFAFALEPAPGTIDYVVVTAPAAIGAVVLVAGAALRYLRLRRDLTSLAVMAAGVALAVVLVPMVEAWGLNFCTIPLLLMTCLLLIAGSMVVSSASRRAGARQNGAAL